MAEGIAEVKQSMFERSCSVSMVIEADPERVWALLTDAERMPQWNSTVTRVEGRIAQGERLRITVPITTRAFTPTVPMFDPPRTMVWQDGKAPMFQGIRTFTVTPLAGGAARFTMTESFRGVLLPLIGRTLPDFAPIFERYADDLRRAAEDGVAVRSA